MAKACPPIETDVRTAKMLAFLALLSAVFLTLVMIRVLQPVTLKANLFFSAWLLLPYGLLAAITAVWSSSRAEALANLSATVFIAGGGLMLLADAIFFRPDAQGPIALLMAPILQAIGIMMLVPLAHGIFRLITTYRSIPNEH